MQVITQNPGGRLHPAHQGSSTFWARLWELVPSCPHGTDPLPLCCPSAGRCGGHTGPSVVWEQSFVAVVRAGLVMPLLSSAPRYSFLQSQVSTRSLHRIKSCTDGKDSYRELDSEEGPV